MPKVPVMNPYPGNLTNAPPWVPYKGATEPDLVKVALVRALGQGAEIAGEIAAREVRETENSLLTKSLTDFHTGADAIIYTPPGPDGDTSKAGFKYRQGKDALESLTPTREALRKVRDKVASDLPTQRLKEAFLTRADEHLIQTDRDMMSHAAAQADREKDLIFKAKWEQSIKRMGLAFDNPNAQMLEAQDMAAILTDEANRRQMPKEVREQMFAGYKAEAVGAVVDGFLAVNDWAGAERILNTMGDALDTKVLENYRRAILPIKNSGQGEAEARRIIATSTDKTGHFDFAQAQEQLFKMAPGPVYDEARSRVEHHAQVYERQEEDKTEALFNEAYSILDRLGTLTPSPTTPGVRPGDLIRLPQLRAAIQGRKAGLWEQLEMKENRMQQPVPDQQLETPEEMALFYQLTQAAASDPVKFLEVRLPQDYGNRLSNRHLEYMNSLQAEIRRAQAQGAAEYNLLKDARIVNYYAEQAGIIPAGKPESKWNTTQTKNYQALFDWVKTHTDEIRLEGKKPRVEDVEEIVRKGLVKVILVGSGFWGPKQQEVFTFSTRPGDHVHEIIPPEYRQEILRDIAAEKKTPTEDLIQATWAVWKASNRVEETKPPAIEPIELPEAEPFVQTGGKE